MFSGAQISLFPMSGDFVGVIISMLDCYGGRLGYDISTLPVGPLEAYATIDLTVSANSPAPR
jgi:hypothetical protein